jgi:hypothetical protein
MTDEYTDRQFTFVSVLSSALFMTAIVFLMVALVILQLGDFLSAIYLTASGFLSLSLFLGVARAGWHHRVWSRAGVWEHPPLAEVTGDD